jgi:hypothetical protein
MKRLAAVVLVSAACTLISACGTKEPPSPPPAVETYAEGPDWYAPPPSVRTYPSPAATIHGWIQQGDTANIRAHAWDIWQSVTSPSPQDPSMPVWETWYSGHEIFDSAPNPTAKLRRHKLRHGFELPRQKVHIAAPGRRVVPAFAERWFSFNRYTRPTAQIIYKYRLWDYVVLRDTNEAFNRLNTPVAQRELRVSQGEVDSESFVLKPVFEFIDGHNPSCVAFWNGDSPAVTSNPNNPIARTWQQFVILDPTNSLKGDTTAGPGIQGCPPNKRWPVVPLSRFYSVVLTQEMVDSLSVFSQTSGDVLGAGNDTGKVKIDSTAKAGNIALLVAMHVTGKEISEWTWQTFWWSPTPNDSLGYDRPATIGSPWNNYQMNTAYQMVTPAHSRTNGTPRVAYNPYLETSLSGILSGNQARKCPSPTWYGVSSNCMSCHRMAAWKDTTRNNSERFTNPPYVPACYVDKGDSAFFAGYTKTDFLWSVAIRTFVPRVPPGVKCDTCKSR